jgi:O-acetyl-ADP-ribose deacetylase (regulator of RNase III)
VIQYVIGDATQPVGNGPKVIAHICNNKGGWGKGFVLAVSNRWKGPEVEYRKWFKQSNSNFGLGKVQVVKVENGLWVANMVAQHGYLTKDSIPIQYDRLEACLKHLQIWAEDYGASIHMPRIGTGLAGGNWEVIESIIQKTLVDVDVFVYDLKKQ